MYDHPLYVFTVDNDLCMKLVMAGTITYVDNNSPTDKGLISCLHISLSSPHQWNPYNVVFPKIKRTLDDEMGELW